MVQTISNPDGTVSIVQLDSSNPIIQLPDGSTAQVHGLAHIPVDQHSAGVHTLAEVAAAASDHQQTLELAGAATGEITQEGHIVVAGEDGQGKDKLIS